MFVLTGSPTMWYSFCICNLSQSKVLSYIYLHLTARRHQGEVPKMPASEPRRSEVL